MKYSIITTSLILAILLAPVVALASPGIPHQFYGTVSFTNGPAPNGLLVEAKIGTTVIGSSQTASGKYGYNPSLLLALDPNNDRSGAVIHFYVSGIDSGETAIFANGSYAQKNLTVAGSAGTVTHGANDIVTNESITITPTSPTTINMGSSLNVTVSSGSNVNATVNEIKKLADSFFTGSTAILSGNNLLNGYEINISGSGLTISVTMNYGDSGINESTIRPYRFNGTTWVEISPFTINTTANTITFSISSAATPYSIFGRTASASTPPPSSGGNTGSGGGGIALVTPTPTPTTLAKGDANQDGKVDIIDFNSLMIQWGGAGVKSADFNRDGIVDIFDFNLLMINWTK